MEGMDVVRDEPAFHVAVIGSGVACSLTLLALLDELKSSPARSPIRIAVIEKDAEFWRGVPYGGRSSPNALIITKLAEFVPDDEHDAFVAWLAEHEEQWTARMQRANPSVAGHWLARNQASIRAGRWDEVFIPRVTYGDFIEQRVNGAVEAAARAGRATVSRVQGEVVGLARLKAGFELTLAGSSPKLEAGLVVLAIGSPPVRSVLPTGVEPGFAYVNDAYDPGMGANLAAIRTILAARAARAERNVLVVGSNATSIELCYHIANDPGFRQDLNRLVTISLGGAFPRPMTRDDDRKGHFPAMEALSARVSISPDDVIVAAESDIHALDRGAVPEIGDRLHHLSRLLVEQLSRLPVEAQRDFHHRHGMRFTRLIRRAGADYSDAVKELAAAHVLTALKGSLVALRPGGGSGMASLIYRPDGGSQDETFGMEFCAVINTGGFEDLSETSSSPLIADLVRSGLARVNPTRRGFVVDDRFRAGEGLYVNGPLLGGIFNARKQMWHVENVRRIHDIAGDLGSEIAQSLSA
ncbi:MAG: FAD/NAD(P)-binding protein [Alsobacter sp.]